MLDLTGFLDGARDVSIFNTTGGGNAWQTWVKPRGTKTVFIFCLGSGGGGGAGFSGASLTARGGGGGGGSSGQCMGQFQSHMLPDILYIQVGVGGVGGSAGALSYVSVLPLIAAANILAVSTTTNPGTGANGSATAGGAGGSGGGGPTPNNASFALLGNVVFQISQNARAGGAHTGAVGGSHTFLQSQVVMGGMGGAGVGTTDNEFAGGAVLVAGIMRGIDGGTAGGGAGNAGYFIRKPFCMAPGSGGGSSGTGTGGRGGDGSYGCGGGGGGGGVTGGLGGRGGDGLVIIVSV